MKKLKITNKSIEEHYITMINDLIEQHDLQARIKLNKKEHKLYLLKLFILLLTTILIVKWLLL